SFFFQAEDGIRDFHVTGVQTCALPILNVMDLVAAPGQAGGSITQDTQTPGRQAPAAPASAKNDASAAMPDISVNSVTLSRGRMRSEERRVGKEGRPAGWADP